MLERELRRLREEIAALHEARTVVAPRSIEVPSVAEFVLSPNYLAQPMLYPQQLTLLRTIFLEDHNFTPYDEEVLEQWSSGFVEPEAPIQDGERTRWCYVGTSGISPDVRQRISELKARGRRWFQYVAAPLGRRGGKGHLAGLSFSFMMWHLIAAGDTRALLNLPPGKQVYLPVFGANVDQARNNLFRDIVNVVTAAPCFAPFVIEARLDRLVLASPADLAANPENPTGTIVVMAAPTTTVAARGLATVAQGWDEVAHIQPSTSGVTGDEMWNASTPAADQFRDWSMFILASSPAQRIGPLYRYYLAGLEFDPATGRAVRPSVLTIQQPSWGLYRDWERASQIPTGLIEDQGTTVFPEIKEPHQLYDDNMRAEEAEDPISFDVERRALWADVLEAFLTGSDIESLFAAMPDGRILEFRDNPEPRFMYMAHGDPAQRRDNFAWVIGHLERAAPDEPAHVVIDVITVWKPSSFDNGQISLIEVREALLADILRFKPVDVSFDQWGAQLLIEELIADISRAGLGSSIHVGERPATQLSNRANAIAFRNALRVGRVHSPHHVLLEQELRNLQDNGSKVDHPSSGPTQTNDVATAVIEVTAKLLANDRSRHDALAALGLRARTPQPDNPFASAFSEAGRRGSTGPADPSRISLQRRADAGYIR